jgi:hypothetical protein
MGILNRFDDDQYLYEDDGPMMFGSERVEERKVRLNRAKEIASGLVLPNSSDDKDTIELARKLNE